MGCVTSTDTPVGLLTSETQFLFEGYDTQLGPSIPYSEQPSCAEPRECWSISSALAKGGKEKLQSNGEKLP